MNLLAHGCVYATLSINGHALTLRETERDGRPMVQAEIVDPWGRNPDADTLLRLMDASRPLLAEIEKARERQ